MGGKRVQKGSHPLRRRGQDGKEEVPRSVAKQCNGVHTMAAAKKKNAKKLK